MKTKIGFALGMMFSVGVLAQSVQDAWNNTPQSCDTGCAMNSVASVTGSQSGSGSWVTYWSGSTTGAVNLPSGYNLFSVTYYIDWTVPTMTSYSGDSLQDRYETILIKAGESTVKRVTAVINACGSQSAFIPTIDYGLSSSQAYGDSGTRTGGSCPPISVSAYVTKIEVFK